MGSVSTAVGVPLAAFGLAVPERGRIGARRSWVCANGTTVGGVLVVAAVAGVAATIIGGRFGWSPELPAFLISAVVGTVVSVVDVRRHRLPHVFTVPAYVACAACLVAASIAGHDYAPLTRSVIAAAGVHLTFLGLALVFPGQLGLGDVVVAGWLSMTLGWLGATQVLAGVVAGFLLQAVVVAVIALSGRFRRRMVLPLGPALVAGWFVVVVCVR